MPLEIFWDKCLAFFEKTHELEQKKPTLQTESRQESADQEQKTSKADIVQNDLIQQTISRIELKLDGLAHQVARIWQILEAQSTTLIEEPEPSRPAVPEPEKITLDFESWLQENKKQFS